MRSWRPRLRRVGRRGAPRHEDRGAPGACASDRARDPPRTTRPADPCGGGDTDAFATGLAHLNPVAARRPDFTLAVFDNGTAGWWGEAGSGRREREPRNSLPSRWLRGELRGAGALLRRRALRGDPRRGAGAPWLLDRPPENRLCGVQRERRGRVARRASQGVPPGHDRTQLSAALRLASDSTTLWTGVLYRADPSGAPPARRDPS